MSLLLTIILALVIIEVVIPITVFTLGLIFCGLIALVEKVLDCCR